MIDENGVAIRGVSEADDGSLDEDKSGDAANGDDGRDTKIEKQVKADKEYSAAEEVYEDKWDA